MVEENEKKKPIMGILSDVAWLLSFLFLSLTNLLADLSLAVVAFCYSFITGIKLLNNYHGLGSQLNG